MRILHTSDWHLGRQFHNLSLLDDQRHVLEQLIELVRDRQIEVVLISGDIYDRSVPPASAVELLDSVLNRLCRELGVPVILIAGNHDGPERLAFGARQLASAGLHIFGPLSASLAPVILRDRAGEVAFYGLPYADPATVREVFGVEVSGHDEAMAFLLDQIRADNGPTRRCVLLSHCFLDGGETSESERPLSLGGADRVAAQHFSGFNYVALGHLHGRQYKGGEQIRYSGSLLKYSFSEERQQKSVTLVEMDENGHCAIEQILLRPLRDMRVLEGELAALLAAGRNAANCEDYLLVRLTDTHAILDAMGKLREVYPNVLHLERPGLLASGERRNPAREQLHLGELAMFGDFYAQVTGNDLSSEQSTIIETALETIRRSSGG